MEKEERVMIFIDGSNHYHIIKKLIPNNRPIDFDFNKFIKNILGNRKLVGVYYYTAPLDISYNPRGYADQQRFFDKLNRIHNFKLVLCRMQKVKINGKVQYQVKEDDIHLAVDMVKFAYTNAYDTAILVSSDGDFVPAVKAIKEISKNIENIGFENVFSYHLRKECNYFRKLERAEVAQFFD